MGMNQKDEHEMKSNQQSSEGRIIFCIHSNKAHVQVYLRAVRPARPRNTYQLNGTNHTKIAVIFTKKSNGKVLQTHRFEKMFHQQ